MFHSCRLPVVVACIAGWAASFPAAAQVTPLPPGQLVVGPIGNTSGPALSSITTGADANIYTGSVRGGFIPTSPASVVRTSVPTQFVRFYNRNNFNTLGPAAFPWVATSNSVRGLTAAQIKNILALPDLPTSAAIVRVPAGTCILGGPGNPALGNFPANPPAVPTPGPWGAAGAPQYYIVGQNAGSGCANPENLPASDFIIKLDMGGYALAYGPNAGGGNPGAVAFALDHASFPAPFTAMDGVYNSLDLLNFTDPAQLRAALNQLGGEINADLVSAALESNRMFMGAVGQRLGAQTAAPAFRSSREAVVSDDGKAQAWLNASASSISINGDGNTQDLGMGISAVAAGLDYQVTPALRLGAAIGYTQSTFSTTGLSSSGSANGYHVALYGAYSDGPLYVDALAGFGFGQFSVGRWISFPGQQGQTSGTLNNQTFGSAVETGYRLRLSNATTLSPIASIQFINVWQQAFSETGAGPLNLDVAARTLASVRGILGASIAQDFELGDGAVLQATVRLGWAHDLAGTERTITESFQQLPSASFQVSGAAPSRNAAVLSVALATPGPVQMFFRYDGFYSAVQQGHVGTAGLSVQF